MRSKTSFFNPTVFWSDCRRCWPLTALYALVWLMLLPLNCLTEFAHAGPDYAPDMLYTCLAGTSAGGYISALLVGIAFAMAMFAYLCDTRATNGLHALPERRETLYVTHYLAGLCCQLMPQVAAVVLCVAVIGAHGVFDLSAMGLMLLTLILPTLFFYSFGVFCMMFTGQILAAPVFYGILNVLVVVVEELVKLFAGNFLYGWAEQSPVLMPFSPIVQLLETGVNAVRYGDAERWLKVTGMEWLWVYAAAGLVFAALALLVYRARRSEATGSTVAIGWARPVFKYGVTFCMALALGQRGYYLVCGRYRDNGTYSLAGSLVCMALAGLIGYFAAEMLLRKSFRVWKSGWRGAVGVTAALVALGVGMSFDLTGYEGYIPNLDNVASVNVDLNMYANKNYCYMTLDDPDAIRLAAAAHRAIINDKQRQQSLEAYNRPSDWSDADESGCYFHITYQMKNGRIVRRVYHNLTLYRSELNDPASPAATMSVLYNDPNVMLMRALGRYGYQAERDPRSMEDLRFTGGYFNQSIWQGERYLGENTVDLTPAQARQVYDAVLRDVAAGHLRASLFEDDGNKPFAVMLYANYLDTRDNTTSNEPIRDEDGRTTIDFDIPLSLRMTETLAVLRTMGVEPNF